MIRLTGGAIVAVLVLIAAIDAAGTPWAYPLGLTAGAVGCLLVAFEGRGAR